MNININIIFFIARLLLTIFPLLFYILYVYNFTSKLNILTHLLFLHSWIFALKLFWVLWTSAAATIFSANEKSLSIFDAPISIIFFWIFTILVWSNEVLFISITIFVDVTLADCIEIIRESWINLVCST